VQVFCHDSNGIRCCSKKENGSPAKVQFAGVLPADTLTKMLFYTGGKNVPLRLNLAWL
jgi:hypothetical protein